MCRSRNFLLKGTKLETRGLGALALLGHLSAWNELGLWPNSHVATSYEAEVTNPNFDIWMPILDETRNDVNVNYIHYY